MLDRFLVLLLIVSNVACHGSVTPQTESASSSGATVAAAPTDINAGFKDPDADPERWVARFETESREVFALRAEIVDAVALQPGEAIADVGAGTGLFVGPFADAVGPEGRIFAVDISPSLIGHLRDRVIAERLETTEVVLSTDTSTRLPKGSVDVVFTCDTYHHFTEFEAMLASIHDALRPGGRFVVVDFERIPGVSEPWLLDHVRADKEQVISEVEAAGFTLDTEVNIEGMDENYFLRFLRP